MPGEQNKHSRGKTTAPAPPPAKVADPAVPATKASAKGVGGEATQKTVDALKEPRAPSVMLYTDQAGKQHVEDRTIYTMAELNGKTAEAIKRQVPQPAKQQAPDPAKQHREPAKQHREPAKEHRKPAKHHREPTKQHREPAKEHREPAKHHREHPKHPGPKVKLTKLKQTKLPKLKEITKDPGKQQHHQ